MPGLGEPSANHCEDGIFTFTVEERYLINLTADDAAEEIRFFSSPGRLTTQALERYWESEEDVLPRPDDETGRRWRTSVVDDLTGVTLLELLYDPREEPDSAFDECMRIFIAAHKDLAARLEEEEDRQEDEDDIDFSDDDEAKALPFGVLA